jgi:hypothetical protein
LLTVLLTETTTNDVEHAVCFACEKAIDLGEEMFCMNCGANFHSEGTCGHASCLCSLLADTDAA